jgi:hypothetical protein
MPTTPPQRDEVRWLYVLYSDCPAYVLFDRRLPVIDRIQAMRTFIRIVETNSFTRAAQSLDMPRATATTLVQNLEALLGTALLVRTTRRLSLTPEGAAYYER